MKYAYIALAALLLGSTSCKKTVEPKVYSYLSDDNAFLTLSDAKAAVNGVYSRLKQPSGRSDAWMYYAGFQVTISDLTTDIGHASSGGDVGLMSDCQWSPNNTYLAFAWQHQYKLVTDANIALYHIPKMSILTDAQKAQFIGELHFLRALGYIDLTDAFGPVVLVDESTVEKNQTNPSYGAAAAPSPVADINKLIISDLQNAAQNLPVDYKTSTLYSTNDIGRATKGAALSLLCKLYMREHEWQKALDLTTEIMKLNYSLYPSYAGLFAEKNKWCQENIFSALADPLTDAVEVMNHFGPINNPQVTDRWQYFALTWYFWNTFGDNDDRKQMFYYDYVGTDGLHYMQAPPGQTKPPTGYYYMPDVATTKFADPHGSTTYYDGHVFPILRYADILLCRAEALNELNGPVAEAISLINQVKGRSHATPLADAGTFTKDALRDAILQERGWEFFFECKRRQDLVRMNKYQSVVNTYLSAVKLVPSITMPRDKYFPYPQAQVDLDKNLSNNDRRQ
ncbi:RagB/SusD family nutrient uptake outer membrane protein [Chitinophaga sp. G-6-1-13]|uniref:RagB/SusD family nutrient uptake outer membrane protein n=1 Tax=Chitinophaga fulva TaxID=2728842 RepID=A0A848GP65_9BACT|nr:RagB/SusD family nutrient uptake outer membrane protein [Chitinophaga fulva]NML38792.1 RagB/SusD family nutrient uptake outer membrane protein [Chitinophaga fulva]